MNLYSDKLEAISTLQEKGYSDDFFLFETELLWRWQQMVIREKDFIIHEWHRFYNSDNPDEDGCIFAIEIPRYHAKGILISEFSEIIYKQLSTKTS